MTGNTGKNKLGKGTPQFCTICGDSYREIQRLPGFVQKCPTCFEKVMNGEIVEKEVKERDNTVI